MTSPWSIPQARSSEHGQDHAMSERPGIRAAGGWLMGLVLRLIICRRCSDLHTVSRAERAVGKARPDHSAGAAVAWLDLDIIGWLWPNIQVCSRSR